MLFSFTELTNLGFLNDGVWCIIIEDSISSGLTLMMRVIMHDAPSFYNPKLRVIKGTILQMKMGNGDNNEIWLCLVISGPGHRGLLDTLQLVAFLVVYCILIISISSTKSTLSPPSLQQHTPQPTPYPQPHTYQTTPHSQQDSKTHSYSLSIP
jgi:hypothetical protein